MDQPHITHPIGRCEQPPTTGDKTTGYDEPHNPRLRHTEIPELSFMQRRNFWSHVDKRGPDECWLWTGSTTVANGRTNPYGLWVVRINGKKYQLRPHRVAFVLSGGVLAPTMTLDHVKDRCSSTLCVNPAHTEAVTRVENTLRFNDSTEDYCKRGHKRPLGHRCRPCDAEYQNWKRTGEPRSPIINPSQPERKSA